MVVVLNKVDLLEDKKKEKHITKVGGVQWVGYSGWGTVGGVQWVGYSGWGTVGGVQWVGHCG